MHDTIFHKILRGEIPAQLVYEDAHLFAFRDIAPQAPVHVLFVPKRDYAKREGFAEDGYRVVMNCNEHGGQTVFQIHLHLLAGAPLGRFGTPG